MTTTAAQVAVEIRRSVPDARWSAWTLHKLLYFCQGHHLAQLGVPLFTDPVVAWDDGPVVGDLWREEKYGSPGGQPSAVRGDLDEAALNTIGYVVSRYGRLSGQDLVNLTHSQTPWLDADAERQRRGARSALIANEALSAYFSDPVDRGPDAADSEPQVGGAELEKFLQEARTREGIAPKLDDFARLRALAASR